MRDKSLYIGDCILQGDSPEVSLKTVEMNGETFFRISDFHEMPPFFMTIVNDGDFWMFVSSTGGLTAGRENADNALFPYVTDDKVHDSIETTGPDTALIVSLGDRRVFWKPFTNHNADLYKIQRNLYKNTMGNKIVFEEENLDLNLTYRYSWKMSSRYGVVKESEIVSSCSKTVEISVLDGIRNILPYGVDALTQTSRSTLIDGYKRNELIESAALGIFTLSSIISDQPEPSESLKATTVWTKGLGDARYLLSEKQIRNFAKGLEVSTEHDIKGQRGAFYVSAELMLEPSDIKKWVIVSELKQSASDVESLMKEIADGDSILTSLEEDLVKGDEKLKKLVFDADGFQFTEDRLAGYRHFSNTLYNIMRGGIYADGYRIPTKDLIAFIGKWNSSIMAKYKEELESLPGEISYLDLLAMVEKTGDPDYERLVLEYLPLTYSRRHGDPSRPWNKFNIKINGENGEQNLNFEGNWRDIFQNWEALSISFPEYIESIISKFVNASTPDGYNPYRITKDGIDWEEPDPSDPWSNIGYWGDHQVIYLLKILEMSRNYHPKKLGEMLSKESFVYANVPYRIKGIDSLIENSKDTIVYDEECAGLIEQRVENCGADGKLHFRGEEIYHVNLMEKLLVVMLSKMSNYIPGGGIWMNTQRPEWNDANNALVGNGVSMVTLYYLYRYLSFMERLMDEVSGTVDVSFEVKAMFDQMLKVLSESEEALERGLTEEERFEMVKKLGKIGESYRQAIYENGFTGEKIHLDYMDVRRFLNTAERHLIATIKENRREDGLYHSYNLLKFSGHTCTLSHLYEMLEGQVAVLSSGALSEDEALNVLEALRNSKIYREDQNSYMLYPERDLPKFLEKNIIPAEAVESSLILKKELEMGSRRFVEKDVNGQYRFNGQFRNAKEIMDALRKTDAYEHKDIQAVGEIFSNLFDHHAFTGRSGTFFKYEGLGSIYWHMVSKLVLAAKENHDHAVLRGAADEADQLKKHFRDLKEGIGVTKSPVKYGAFPTDAYSHTPSFAGVQQPGMTGQVKEDIITRFSELGVFVSQGEISFAPTLLSEEEFIKSPVDWMLPGRKMDIRENQLGFTLCSVPVIYECTDHDAVSVFYENGDRYTFENCLKLNREISSSIFRREAKFDKIIVQINWEKVKSKR